MVDGWRETQREGVLWAGADGSKGCVIVPCVEDLSDGVAVVVRGRSVSVYVRPPCTLEEPLVRPRVGAGWRGTCGVVSRIPCCSCGLKCMRKAGGEFDPGLGERRRVSGGVPQV